LLLILISSNFLDIAIPESKRLLDISFLTSIFQQSLQLLTWVVSPLWID
jgi:hypothetical protein